MSVDPANEEKIISSVILGRRTLIKENLDWDMIMSLASKNDLIIPIYDRLNNLRESIPNRFEQEAISQKSSRNEFLLELKHFVNTCKKLKINYVVFGLDPFL